MKIVSRILVNFVLPLAVLAILFSINTIIAIAALLLYIGFLLYMKRASIYTLIGSSNYSKGNLENAILWFKKAYETGRAKPRAITSYGYLLLKTGRLEEAEKIFEQILSTKISSEDMMFAKSNMALALWKTGDLDSAVSMLEEVFIEFKTTTIYGSLGYLLILKGDYEKALAFNLEAYEYNGTNSIILDNLGQNYYLIGEYEKSEEIYAKLIAANPTFPEAYYNYGLLLEAKGEKDRALEFMKKALNYKLSFLSTVSMEEIHGSIKKLEEETQ